MKTHLKQTVLLLMSAAGLHAQAVDLAPAFNRLYNFDFPGAHKIIEQQIAAHPDDATVYWVQASAYLFSELDRLNILQSEFLKSDEKIGNAGNAMPDPQVKRKFLAALESSRARANSALASHPDDAKSLFALAISDGLQADYLALVEKRQRASLQPAKESQKYAIRVMQADPNLADAYLTTGISEYLLGSLPHIVRIFVHFEMVKGSKKVAVENLSKVSKNGQYLGPFARILLSIIYLRDDQRTEARDLLKGLAAEYPENQLFRRELAKLT